MALSIKNPEVDRLARALAEETGESLTEAILRSLEERLHRLRERRGLPELGQGVREIQRRIAALPVLDDRPDEEILGFDDTGLPG